MTNRMWIISLAFLLVAMPVGISLPLLPWLMFGIWWNGLREECQLVVVPRSR